MGNVLGCMFWVIIGVFAYTLYSTGSLPSFLSRRNYVAEVGDYAGEEQRCETGRNRNNLDECRSDVNAIAPAKNQRSTSQLCSTACRIMDGEQFTDRTR